MAENHTADQRLIAAMSVTTSTRKVRQNELLCERSSAIDDWRSIPLPHPRRLSHRAKRMTTIQVPSFQAPARNLIVYF